MKLEIMPNRDTYCYPFNKVLSGKAYSMQSVCLFVCSRARWVLNGFFVAQMIRGMKWCSRRKMCDSGGKNYIYRVLPLQTYFHHKCSRCMYHTGIHIDISKNRQKYKMDQHGSFMSQSFNSNTNRGLSNVSPMYDNMNAIGTLTCDANYS